MKTSICSAALITAAILTSGCVDLTGEETGDLTTTEQALTTEPLRTPSSCAIFYRAEAVIDAPASTIWNLLTDLPHYGDWNPWVLEAEGDLVPGGAVTVQVDMINNVMTAEHYVLVVDDEQTLCWRDAGWNSWFVQAQRCRYLEPRPDGTVWFHQELFLDGWLAYLGDLTNGAALRAGIAAETAALKQHAEAP